MALLECLVTVEFLVFGFYIDVQLKKLYGIEKASYVICHTTPAGLNYGIISHL